MAQVTIQYSTNWTIEEVHMWFLENNIVPISVNFGNRIDKDKVCATFYFSVDKDAAMFALRWI